MNVKEVNKRALIDAVRDLSNCSDMYAKQGEQMSITVRRLSELVYGQPLGFSQIPAYVLCWRAAQCFDDVLPMAIAQQFFENPSLAAA